MKPTTHLNKNILWTVLIIVLTTVAFSSCQKKEDPDPQGQQGSVPTPSFPQPSDADAVLVAVNSSVPSPVSLPSIPGMPAGGEMVIDIGMGIALFKGNAKADKVVLNSTELTFTNGVYTWLPNFTNITDPTALTGINLSGNIVWNVTNPNIQKTLSNLPGKPRVSSGKVITSADGYVLINNRVSGADKILYAVHANNKTVMKELDGNSTQCTFTAAELAKLGTTKQAIIQANAYVITNETISGKKVYFVRQSSYSVTGVEIK